MCKRHGGAASAQKLLRSSNVLAGTTGCPHLGDILSLNSMSGRFILRLNSRKAAWNTVEINTYEKFRQRFYYLDTPDNAIQHSWIKNNPCPPADWTVKEQQHTQTSSLCSQYIFFKPFCKNVNLYLSGDKDLCRGESKGSHTNILSGQQLHM